MNPSALRRRDGRPRLATLAALAVMASVLAGCTGGPSEEPGYAAEAHGHLVEGIVSASQATVTGVEVTMPTTGLALLPQNAPAGAWAALVVAGAQVEGVRGTLFALHDGSAPTDPDASPDQDAAAAAPTIRLEGKLRATYRSVALSAGNLTGFLAETKDRPLPPSPLGPAPHGTDRDTWEEASWTRQTADPLALHVEMPATLHAPRILLLTEQGLEELPTTVTLEQATSFGAPMDLRGVQPPQAVTLEQATTSRVQVFLAEPEGTLRLGARGPLTLQEETLLDGIQPVVHLRPPRAEGEPVRAEVRLRTFQVYHGDEVLLPARLEAEPTAPEVTLDSEGAGSFRLHLREASGDADAVFRDVRIDGHQGVHVPDFQSVWDAWPEDLRRLMTMGPWVVNFVILTAFLEVVRILTGDYLPQPLLAGHGHSVTVGMREATPGDRATIVFEGRNFDDLRVAVTAQ